MVAPTTATAIRDTLSTAMDADPAVMLLGDAVGRAGGIAGTSHGLLARFGAERVLDCPTADQGTLSLALGLALGGRKPVVELSDATGLAHGLQVLAEAGAAARGEFACPLVVRVPVGGQAGRLDAPAAALLAPLDGITVAMASDADQAASLLRAALASRAPTVLLEDRALYGERGAHGAASATARVVREGTTATVATWGAGVSAALQVDGVEVLDLVQLSPLDVDALGASVRRTGRLIAAGEPHLAALVLQHGLSAAFEYLESPLATCQATPDAIAAAVQQALAW